MKQRRPIKSWAGKDRPREKLIENGRRALTDVELLAILIGTGSVDESAVDLARRLLHDQRNDLNQLAKCSVQELAAPKGMGVAKAVRIVAALELGRRHRDAPIPERPVLSNSLQVYEYLRDVYMDLRHEESWVVFLDSACRVVRREMIGRGGTDFTPVDIKVIMRYALECSARFLIVSHNHPSGTLNASRADIQLTKRLMAASQLLEIELSDHVIFCDQGYFSFRDEGLLG